MNPISYLSSLFSCKACHERVFSSSDPEIYETEITIDQHITSLVLPLFTCLLVASYCTYRSCFQAKKREGIIEEQIHFIASTQFSPPSPLHLETQHPNHQNLEPLTLDQVIQRAQEMHMKLKGTLFPRLIGQHPTAIDQIKNLYSEEEVLHAFKNSRVLIPPSVANLMDGFLHYKLKFGSPIEKELYASMPQKDFIARLITKRPLVFSGKSDDYRLRDGSSARFAKFEIVGTDQEKQIQLKDYLSYDEMEIAALIGISVPSHFINRGDSLNEGSISKSDDYERIGTCFSLVGARLDREGTMEFQRLMVTSDQNTLENGYGPLPETENQDNAKTAKLRLFAKFYGIDYFPTYEEVCANNQHYVKCSNGFISESLYKYRIKITIENFLVNANKHGEEHRQPIYAQPYGWGLDHWMQTPIQRQWFIEAFLDVIQKGDYPFISDVDFSSVMKYQSETRSLKDFCERHETQLNAITLHFPELKKCRQLCEKLPQKHSSKRLANSYDGNANAYPGNEYWNGQLSAASASLMMCASPLQLFALMPEINPYLMQNIYRMK